jgi:IS1 family transposase/transposase-like protein
LTFQTANFFCVCKIEINCWHCQSLNLVKNGKTANKKQKYRCKDCGKQFIFDYTYQGCRTEVRRLILKMTLNSSGIRDISRVLSVSTNTVLSQIRRRAASIPEPRVPTHAARVELDEFWSFVGKKKNQRWTWLAITSSTRRIGAFVNGRRTDDNCRQLMQKYERSRVVQFSSDDWLSYQKFVPAEKHYIGKDQTQRIERVNLNFRTHLKRLHRRGIGFSKSEEMHDAVIKLYVYHHNQRHHKI